MQASSIQTWKTWKWLPAARKHRFIKQLSYLQKACVCVCVCKNFFTVTDRTDTKATPLSTMTDRTDTEATPPCTKTDGTDTEATFALLLHLTSSLKCKKQKKQTFHSKHVLANRLPFEKWEKLCEFDYPPNYSPLGRAVTFPQSVRSARVSPSTQGKIILGVSEAHKNLQASLRSALQTPKLEKKMSFGGEGGNHRDHKRSSNIRREESGWFPTLLGERSVDLWGKKRGGPFGRRRSHYVQNHKANSVFCRTTFHHGINSDGDRKFPQHFRWSP